jgi:RND family efflux transporter MFP subunit
MYPSRNNPHKKRRAELLKEMRDVRDDRPVVEVMLPKRSTASTELSLPGDVEAMQSTSIYARANGYLKKINVDIGDEVKAGHELAVIDVPELEAELEQARATKQAAEVTVGRANNEHNFKKATFERFEGLSKTGGVTQQQLDEKRSEYNLSKSSLLNAQAVTASAEASIKRIEAMLSFAKIAAPFDGTITARNYDVGALLSSTNSAAGREIFRIEETKTLKVQVKVPQSYVTDIRKGDEATLSVRNHGGRPFKGVVARSAGALDPTTRTLRFEVHFRNDDGALMPGMYGQVKFKVSPKDPALLVPTSAFVFQADGMKVLVVDGGKIRSRRVSVGRDFGTEAEVAEGLKGDEQVVTTPGERLVEGTAVTVHDPTRTAEGHAPAKNAQVMAR